MIALLFRIKLKIDTNTLLYVLCMQLISTVVNRNWTDIARYGSLENWRELLAAMVTYAGPEDFAPLCGKHLFMDVLTLHMYVHVVCIYHCWLSPSSQSFYRQIAGYTRGAWVIIG